MPINISGSAQLNATGAGGGPVSSNHTGGQAGGALGLFASLLDIVGNLQGDTGNAGNARASQNSNAWFDIDLGPLQLSGGDNTSSNILEQMADALRLDQGESADAGMLEALNQLVAGTDQNGANLDPQSPLGKLLGQLSDLLNSLAGKMEGRATGEVNQQAKAARDLAQALLQKLGGADVNLDLDASSQTGAQSGQPAAQAAHDGSSNTPLPAQLRALAADLDLVRHNIPIPSARADAEAIFNGKAPSLDQLLQPGQNGQSASETDGNESRLSETLGAKLAARAGAAANQPATNNAPGPNSSAVSLAATLAAQQGAAGEKPADPVINMQVTPTGAPTISGDTSMAARPMQAAYQAPQINLPNLAFEISRQFQAGNNRFQIRMDPPELGRIDVRMDVDAHGAVHARLAVDRPETLEMLQRDARALERALQQAGLDSSKTNLEFSLRQNPFAGQQNSEGGAPGGWTADHGATSETVADSDTEITRELQAATAYRGYASPGGVNLWV